MADPENCRENANRCLLMASQATDAHLRSILVRLAKAWVKLAEQLEHKHELGDALPGRDIINRIH
jgi:hypothetical protein